MSNSAATYKAWETQLLVISSSNFWVENELSVNVSVLWFAMYLKWVQHGEGTDLRLFGRSVMSVKLPFLWL